MRTGSLILAAIAGTALLTLSSCGGKNTITGRFAGLGDGAVVVDYAPLNHSGDLVLDTIYAKGGRFTYDLKRDDTVFMYIHFPAFARKLSNGQPYRSMQLNVAAILTPGGQVHFKGSVEDPNFVSYTVNGSGFNADFAAHREFMRDLAVRADSIEFASVELDDDLAVQDLGEQYSAVLQQMNALRMEYVEANSDTDLAAHYVAMQSMDSFGEWYDLLGENARNGLFTYILAEGNAHYKEYEIRAEAATNVAPGAQAPEFTLMALDGKQVSLSDIEGEYIVLDFWGSWCVWCIRGFPEMKKYYEKYKDRLTIVGIACRDTEEAWRKGVADNALPWLQLLNDLSGDMSKDVSALYAIQGYPTKVILDRDHRIVEVVIGEDPAFYEKLDELFK